MRTINHRTSNKASTFLWAVILLQVVLLASGCHFPSRIVERTHSDYNQAIRQTGAEQLLLNVVRVRYDEMPLFLEISSISTQFSIQQSVGVTGTIYENVGPTNVPNVWGLSGNASYSESPIVTWSVPESREFLGKMMAPLSADQLTVLVQSGWGEQRLVRLCTKKMNRLRNRSFVVNESAYTPETYEQFKEALLLVEQLRKEGFVDLAYGARSNVAAAKIPVEQIDTKSIPLGLEQGVYFLSKDDPKVVEPVRISKSLFLLFSKDSDQDSRARRLRDLLDLDPARYSFGFVDAGDSGREQLLTESGRLVQVMDPSVKLTEIIVNNRSMAEIVYFVSRGVQIPEEHVAFRAAALAKGDFEEWLHVRHSRNNPANAWLKVKHRGYWFYIAADDIASRRVFTMLETIFESVVGTVPGAKPLLTLPVR
jgi:hypothetical protein